MYGDNLPPKAIALLYQCPLRVGTSQFALTGKHQSQAMASDTLTYLAFVNIITYYELGDKLDTEKS